jgi:DNA-binding MarR family transcriptional regulator
VATARQSEKAAIAAAAWRRLFDFFISTRAQRDRTLERFRLTPNDAKALSTLDAKRGKPMRTLADAWGTDASNATWVVDRLERLGLAERRTVPHDRRVKLVVLTQKGRRIRDEIMRAFYRAPAELMALESYELRELVHILDKLTPESGTPHPLSPDRLDLDTERSGG